ncbi:MAG: aspartate aminotransferase family protein [Ardenticatenaceae bacterium]|nr:aspartate aminotransferase family protein [Ardenticatenaceae bacterium]
MDSQTRPLEELTVDEVPILRTQIPGPRSQQMWERGHRYDSPGLSALATLSQIVLERGRGSLIRDLDGNVYIDFAMGMVGVSTGHSHPDVRGAIQQEMEDFLHTYDMASTARVEFFESLADILPAQLQRYQMYSGGTETVEAGMRLAKSYTGKYEFIGLYRSFHGKTLGSLSLMGSGYKNGFGPRAPGYMLTPNAYCYRCPLGLEPSSCAAACADMIEEIYQNQSTGQVAAVVLEPVQAAGGIIVPPPEFLQKIAAFCKRHNILLFVDEIFTTAGRTGKMWSFEHYGIEPDIISLGKGIGSGYPLGVIASSEEIMEGWPWAQHAGGSTTFGGNSVAARAGQMTLQVIRDEKMIENAAEVGAHMLARLRDMQTRHPVMGDVRGLGLVLGVEYVRNRETKEPISSTEAEFLFRQCLQRGLMVPTATAIMRIVPALNISKELADKGLDILEESIDALEKWMELE